MKVKKVLPKALGAIMLIAACFLSINSLSADDIKPRRDTKKYTVGEDGLAWCHCFTTGYRCYCLQAPSKPILGSPTYGG
jgi:hypothetical protein